MRSALFALVVALAGCEATVDTGVGTPEEKARRSALGTVPSTYGTQPERPWAVGDAVFVEWKGKWWNARIVAVEGARYRIHYDGWGIRWDETVDADRMAPIPAEGP